MQIEDLLQAKLLDFQEDVIDITESADKQLKIQSVLEEMQEFWNTAEFKFATWGKRETPCMLSGLTVGEIIERLDEDQMQLSTLNANRYVAPFKVEVETKIKVFSDVNETLDQWINQRPKTLEFPRARLHRRRYRQANAPPGQELPRYRLELDENHGKIRGNQKSHTLLSKRYAQGFPPGPP